MASMSSLIETGEKIFYQNGSKKGGKTFPAEVESKGKVFPHFTDGSITTLSLIAGNKERGGSVKAGLATSTPNDLWQARTENGKRILLFAIANSEGQPEFYYSEKHELDLFSCLHDGEQARVAEKSRELDNKVPGSSDRILFSEPLVEKAMKTSKVSSDDKGKKKGGRPKNPPKKSEESVQSESEDDFFETPEPTKDASKDASKADKPKKKPGRPKKSDAEKAEKAEKDDKPKKKPGRPKKSDAEKAEPMDESKDEPKEEPKKKRGRPRGSGRKRSAEATTGTGKKAKLSQLNTLLTKLGDCQDIVKSVVQVLQKQNADGGSEPQQEEEEVMFTSNSVDDGLLDL